MILFPAGPAFGKVVSSHGATRPATSFGAVVTPGLVSVFGAYATILSGANNTDDSYGILINVNSNSVAANARDTLMTIGLDAAGGTTFTTFIADLLVSCANNYESCGVWYFFPVFIKAGSTIGAKATVNNLTVGTFACNVTLLCCPRRPEAVRAGSYVDTFGAVEATSSGTAVTSGTTSEGTYTLLASSIARPCWFWQAGFGVNDATMSALTYHMDLAAGSSTTVNKNMLENGVASTSAAESLDKLPIIFGCEGFAATGDNIYGRLQCSGTPDSALSMIAYGVGG